MITRLLLLVNRFSLTLTIAYLILITVLSFIPIDNVEVIGLEHDDKLMHLGAYMAMVLLVYLSMKKTKLSRPLFFSAFFCLVYGIIIEFLQPMVSDNRVFDQYDIIANAAGICVGLAILVVIKMKLNSNKPLLF